MSYFEGRACLAGKTAVVIGGGTGIGAAVSLALAKTGVNIAFCDFNEEGSAVTKQALADMGQLALARHVDVMDAAALDTFYDEVGAACPRVDILVNLVGGVFRRLFMDSTPEHWEADIRRNYGYMLQSSHRAINLIRRHGEGGSIINFTTIEAQRGAGSFAVYAGAKAAIRNFTRALAVELGAEGIRVNCIAPDSTPSRGNTVSLDEETMKRLAEVPIELFAQSIKMYIPMGELVPEQALGDAVVFLASSLSKHITGASLPVDGGTSASLGFLDWPHGDGFLPAPFAGSTTKLFG